MLTVCTNCNEVFHREDGKCPYCKTPVPELPPEYEAEKAKILAEKEEAIKKSNKEQSVWSKVLLIGFLCIILSGILMSAMEKVRGINICFLVAICGLLAVVLAIGQLWGGGIGKEYDERLEKLDAEYFSTPAEYEKIIQAFIDGQKTTAKQLNCPKVADQTYTIKCPTCGSPDCERISGATKAVNAAAFGLYGNKRNKQFRCNNCKYMW